MAESYKLIYFNLRALAEPIRFIFEVAGVKYEDFRIERADWPGVKDKYEKMGWGQLPLLQVDGKTLCQSNAICRYLAKKFNLVGDNEWETAKLDELVDALGDLLTETRKHFLETDEAKKAELKKTFDEVTLPRFFGKYEAQIASGSGPYLLGQKLTWVDLKLANSLEYYLTTSPDVLKKYPKLEKLKNSVYDIPQIKAWVAKRPVTEF